MEDDKQKFADDIYDGILSALFHSKISGAQLHIDIQKGGAEEIGLRVGNAPYFGVISVGDAKELGKLLQTAGFLCEVKAFGTASLFATINSQDSTINILIGSKKFTEGWSSWRVSAMGLMNVGRSEGSEVIQLFGRGVRCLGQVDGVCRVGGHFRDVTEKIALDVERDCRILAHIHQDAIDV